MDISTTIDLISLVLFAVGLGITIGKIKNNRPAFLPPRDGYLTKTVGRTVCWRTTLFLNPL